MSHSGNRPQPSNDGSNPGEESGLLSKRSLTIMALSSVIAVLAGLSAGLTTGINIAHGASPGWALAAGLTAGLAAAATAGLAAAVALHALVTKRAALAASTGTPPGRDTILGLPGTVRHVPVRPGHTHAWPVVLSMKLACHIAVHTRANI
jgi:hypothetical protein